MSGAFMVTTGNGTTADEASAELFPEEYLVALVDTREWGDCVTYTFFVAPPDRTR